MDKTLDLIALIHRLIIGVALALFIVGASAQRPNKLYDNAEGELDTLEDAIEAVSDQVNQSYKIIYEQSDLKVSTLAWLQKRTTIQNRISFNVVDPGDLSVPSSSRNPLVTLDAQVKWADRVYRTMDSSYFLCAVDREQVFRALDKMFDASAKPEFEQLNIYVHGPQAGGDENHVFTCEVELRYSVEIGKVSGLRSAILDLPTAVVNVTGLTPWMDLEIASTLKDKGLGDYEDLYGVQIPALRELWTAVGSLSPGAAKAFLEQKKADESEKLKEKIDILGESLSRSLTITMASIVEVCLMVYLLAYLMQIRITLPGHEAAVFESPFFGIMHSGLGRMVMLSTLLIPFGACLFALIYVFPSFQAEWPGPKWIIEPMSRWGLVVGCAFTDLLLILEVRRIFIALGRGRKHAVTADAGLIARKRQDKDTISEP